MSLCLGLEIICNVQYTAIVYRGNRQKSPWKKSFWEKVLKFYTLKVLWKKSPFIEKSP